jgi:hypothetical protein
MRILFWGPVTLQYFHFDVKNAKPTKNFFRSRARALARPKNSALAHWRGPQKFLFKPPHDGYQKTQNFMWISKI